MSSKQITITFEFVPEDMSPTNLAHIGERMALQANPAELNPSPAAWARAGISANQILRFAYDGRMHIDMLVAIIAGNSDPATDNTTPARTVIIGGHKSIAEKTP